MSWRKARQENPMNRSASAREKLAEAFHAVGDNEEEQRARDGMYGDFTSPYATPIVTLVKRCREKGYNDIALRAINGDFDG